MGRAGDCGSRSPFPGSGAVQDQCKQRMNTFAFTGDLKNAPEVSCVYHSEEAENQYMNMLGKAPPVGKALPP